MGAVLLFVLQSQLPVPLQEWLAADAEADITLRELLLLPVLGIFVVAAVVASMGLFLLRRWAFGLYIATTLAGFLLWPLLGPTVEHGVVTAMTGVATTAGGIALGIGFFGNLPWWGGRELA